MNNIPNSVRLIDNHLSKFFKDDEVFVIHEKESDIIHADVYVVKPDVLVGRDYYILLTCGLSAIKMNVPKGINSPQFAELVLLLPSSWDMTFEKFNIENNWWPFRLLKELMKHPHENNTWFGLGHTFSYPSRDYFSDKCKFEGAILLDSVKLPKRFLQISRLFKDNVKIFSIIPLYKEEINFKEHNGTSSLLKIFAERNFSEIVEVEREILVS